MLIGAARKADVNFTALDSYIAKAVQDFELTGLAIAVVKDSTVVFSKGYGFKDVTTHESITTGSLFNIASCTKAMTAACLAVLVEEGTLNWKDKVIDHLPEFRLKDPYLTREMEPDRHSEPPLLARYVLRRSALVRNRLQQRGDHQEGNRAELVRVCLRPNL